MTQTTAVANRKLSITAYLNQDNVKNQVQKAVGKNSMRFVSSVISAVTVNPALKECDNNTILSAALLGESLNLSPSPQLGQYYMVPFENKKKGVKEAQFIIGYKGYVQLAIRSGYYKKINVLPIKEGELVSFNALEEEIKVNLIEDEEERENAKTIGYYAMFEYLNGFRKAIYWTKKKMLGHADHYSKAFSAGESEIKYTDKYSGKEVSKKKVSFEDYVAGKYDTKNDWMYSSFWYKDFDAMACKTMIRQLISKWGIMSIEMQEAYDKDSAVIREDGTPDYVDNEPEDIIEPEPEVKDVFDQPETEKKKDGK